MTDRNSITDDAVPYSQRHPERYSRVPESIRKNPDLYRPDQRPSEKHWEREVSIGYEKQKRAFS